ncbi:hypothetical protein FHY19_002344 [Xanthomonas arboricola]|nr:hypothetical protein [Xanthomonas sp. 4461]
MRAMRRHRESSSRASALLRRRYRCFACGDIAARCLFDAMRVAHIGHCDWPRWCAFLTVGRLYLIANPLRPDVRTGWRLSIRGCHPASVGARLRATRRPRESSSRASALLRAIAALGKPHRAQARSYVRLRHWESHIARKRAPTSTIPLLRMRGHRCALSFRCDAGDTQRSLLLATVACFLTGAASLLRDPGIPCSAPIRTVYTCPFSPWPLRPARLLRRHWPARVRGFQSRPQLRRLLWLWPRPRAR